MGVIRDTFRGFWASRSARYQADALRAQAEAQVHRRRRDLAGKPHKSASDLMEQQLLESAGVGLLGGWGDQAGAFKDYLSQMLDFSRGGLGTGAGITNHTGRRGGDYPFITSESHLAAHRDFSRLVSPNPNIQGLLGGRRRYTIGTGATVRVKPRGDSPAARDAAVRAQAFLDAFNKANRMPFRLRSFYDRSSIDGEGIWRLFPREDGLTDVRAVYSEQLRCPPGENPDQYEYGVCTDPEDQETAIEYAVFPLQGNTLEYDAVRPEEIIFYGRNRQDAVKRSLPDWTLATGEVAELADDLANNMGQGSALQAAIAFIRQHEGVPGESVRAFATADASYTKTDPYTGANVPVRKFQPGTIVDTNKNTVFLASPYNAGIEAHGQVFQLLMNRVSARWNAPKWLATSNNDEVNFASSLTAESPFVLNTIEDQEYLSEPVRVVNERALAVAAAVGRLVANTLDLVEVEVTFPSPVARDRQAESAARTAELADGYLSPQMAADQAGYEWAEVLKERAAAVAAGWTPPQAAAKPGQPGQPGGAPPATPPTAAATESLLEAWSEDQHPRDDHGQFVSGEAMVAAKSDPAKAAELRKQVTDPGERKKLDAAIGGGPRKGAGGKKAGKVTIKKAEAKAKEAQQKWWDAHQRGDEAEAKQQKYASYLYHLAAKHAEDGEPNKAATAMQLAGEFASGDRKPAAAPAKGAADKPAASGGEPRSATDPESVKSLHMQLDSEMPKLNDADLDGLDDYLSGAYEGINNYLRTGAEPPRAKEAIPKVEAAIAKAAPLKEPVLVHRGLRLGGITGENFVRKARQAAESGEPLEDKGFVSTSIDPQVASDWAKGGKKPVVMEIVAHQGLYIGRSAGGSKEKEFLMQHGTRFKVHGVEERDGVTVIRAEQVVADRPAHESLSEHIHAALYKLGLTEAGFTGTDRLGRRWENGKEVAKDAGGGGDTSARGSNSRDVDPHPNKPAEAHVWGEIHDALPDAVKSDPGLVAKARRVAGTVYATVWNFLATQGGDLLPEILDTSADYEKITYSKMGAQGQAQHDPFYEHLGVPYSAVSAVVSKVLAAAHGYVKGRLAAREAVEALREALSDDQRREVAAAVAELFKQVWGAMGVQAPVPAVEDVLKRMGERATAPGTAG